MKHGKYTDVITKEYRPSVQAYRDDLLARREKEFFWPTGTQVYCGRQGSGKTISAVKHIQDLKSSYPQAIVVSNLVLNNFTAVEFSDRSDLNVKLLTLDPEFQYIYYRNMEQLQIALVGVNNSTKGVIYLIDEIHTYFNALESKNIPMYVFTEISQQRKQRKLIVGTSQLFLRMAKPFREQCDNLIMCNTFMGVVTFQRAFDGMTLDQDYDGKLSGHVKKKGWFFHTRKLRKSYDTYQKVVSGSEQYESVKPMKIESKGKKITIK